MSALRHSIRWRLFTVVFGAALAVLLLSGAGFYFFEKYQARRTAVDAASALAAAISKTLGAAVVFRDARTAEELLAAFQVDSDIREARVVLPDASLFASYRAAEQPPLKSFPADLPTDSILEIAGTLYISTPIVVGGERVGDLQMEHALSQISALLTRFRMFWAGELLIGVLLSILAAVSLAEIVARPLLDLAGAMGRVSHEKDFSMRVEHHGDREIEQLYAGFNTMLSELGKRDAELQEHRETLEQRVAERTEALREEIRMRQQIEDALIREQELLRSVIRNAPVAVAMLDTELRFLAHSDKWLHDYELGEHSIVGRTYDEVFPATPARWGETLRRALAGAPEECAEDLLELIPGVPTFLRWAVHPWARHEGTPGGIIVATEKIDDLVRARLEAENNAQLKTQFLTNVSHELRTPLNGILGITELLLEDEVTEDQRIALATVHGSGKILLSLINDLLDLSRLEAGRIELQAEEFDPRALIRESVNLVEQAAKLKGIGIVVDVSEDVPPLLLGDSLRLKQVVLNLLGNAVKFTETGKVTVRLDRESGPSNTPSLRWQITDTGIGIAEEELKNIFKPFTQADGSITRRFGGTGLGLAISDQLVRLLGGELSVSSVPGKGSAFSFFLPETPTVERFGLPPLPFSLFSTKHTAAPATQKLHVLVAEDNVVNQRVVATMLARDGHEVTVVPDGAEALAALARESFDVVVMDIQMPVLSGVDATTQIRQLADPAKRDIPIIALTAHAFEAERLQALHAGVSVYLTKPIDRGALRSAINQVVTGPTAHPNPVASLN